MTISLPPEIRSVHVKAVFVPRQWRCWSFRRARFYAQDKDPLVAKVNGVEVHQSDLAVAEEEAGQIPPMSPEAKQDYLVQFVADMILVSKAAEDKKFGEGAEFKRKLEFSRKKLLMEGLLQSVGKQALTDEAMHKVYDDAVKQIGEEKEVHARHILFRVAAGDEKASKEAEEKLKAVIARLKKGEDFAKVAAEVTEDPSGKANGGDLGYFSKDQMVPEFSEAAFKLEHGQISEPVKTQFGWHVIKVEDKRVKPAPKFEEVKPRSRISSFARRRPSWSPNCAPRPRSSAWTSRRRPTTSPPPRLLPRRRSKTTH